VLQCVRAYTTYVVVAVCCAHVLNMQHYHLYRLGRDQFCMSTHCNQFRVCCSVYANLDFTSKQEPVIEAAVPSRTMVTLVPQLNARTEFSRSKFQVVL